MGVSMSQITSGLPGDVINVAFAANDYKRARDSGKSVPVSAAKAFTSFAWGEFYYGGFSALNGAIANSASKFAKSDEVFSLISLTFIVFTTFIFISNNKFSFNR